MPKADFKTRWPPLDFSIYLSFHERDRLFFDFFSNRSPSKRNYLETKPNRGIGSSPVLRPSWHSTVWIEPTISAENQAALDSKPNLNRGLRLSAF